MKQIKDFLRTFISAVASGICIGIGATAYLLCPSKLFGAFLFVVGLCTVLLYGFRLFTGMVGYLIDNRPVYILKLVVVWLGNFLGTLAAASVLLCTRLSSALNTAAGAVVETKLADSHLSLFILGIFCGVLMFLGVDSYKKYSSSKDFTAIFMPVVSVVVFIVAGFEHCVADMYYFAAAGRLLEGLPAIAIITLGNTLGGSVMPILSKLSVARKEK